jgi:hypothetical protein
MEQRIARLRTANMRFTDAQTERIWAIVSAHQAGLSIRKIAGATGLSSSRIHQLLNAPEAKGIPVWLRQLRWREQVAATRPRGALRAAKPAFHPRSNLRSPHQDDLFHVSHAK